MADKSMPVHAYGVQHTIAGFCLENGWGLY
jgi:hypothetical protein